MYNNVSGPRDHYAGIISIGPAPEMQPWYTCLYIRMYYYTVLGVVALSRNLGLPGKMAPKTR